MRSRFYLATATPPPCMLATMAAQRTRNRAHPATRTLAALALGAAAVYSARVLLNFFGPPLPYRLSQPMDLPLDAPEFVQFLSCITNGAVRPSHIRRLRNGSEFYPAELDAIRAAQHAINLEFYEFQPGRVADALLAALCERARAGVEVRVLIDALGSFTTPDSYFRPLRAAGGRMHWYHPIRWNTWQHLNNRTHRKLIVIDGQHGFIGGAGIADHWLYSTPKDPAWRDTVLHMEGEAVTGLISTFAENWLEASGTILSGPLQFAFAGTRSDAPGLGGAPGFGGSPGFIVLSTPHDGGTQARVLFEALIQSARRTLSITTPYFLPDRSARYALEQAARRGVDVQIITAGPHIDHPFVRRISERSSRRLLQAGARIFEYQPAMIHAKLMTVDSQWCVAGSTNFDHRSFGLNDEVNLAVLDPILAAVLESDFAGDRAKSHLLTPATLRQRRLFGGADDLVDDVLEYES